MVIGSRLDDTGAIDAGSVFIFDPATCDNVNGSIPGDEICEIPKLILSNPNPSFGDEFGGRVASTPNGDIVVSAFFEDTNGINNTGAAYIFDPATCDLNDEIPGDGICKTPKLTLHNPTPENGDVFGESIGFAPNGDVIVGAVGDNTGGDNAGAAYVFEPDTCDNVNGSIPGDEICEIPKLTLLNPTPEPGDIFGVATIASTPDGKIIVAAYHDNTNAFETGSVYIFDPATCDDDSDKICKDENITINNPTPQASESFGSFVASTPNGDILVSAFFDTTGAFRAGSVYLYESFTLTPQQEIEALIQELEDAVTNEEIGNEANGLLAKLNQIIEKLEKEHSDAACNQLGAFINQIEGIIQNGTQEEVDALIPIRDAAVSFQTNNC